jgi:hypothetical protein
MTNLLLFGKGFSTCPQTDHPYWHCTCESVLAFELQRSERAVTFTWQIRLFGYGCWGYFRWLVRKGRCARKPDVTYLRWMLRDGLVILPLKA